MFRDRLTAVHVTLTLLALAATAHANAETLNDLAIRAIGDDEAASKAATSPASCRRTPRTCGLNANLQPADHRASRHGRIPAQIIRYNTMVADLRGNRCRRRAEGCMGVWSLLVHRPGSSEKVGKGNGQTDFVSSNARHAR